MKRIKQMLFKTCRCGKKIEYSKKYCNKCELEVTKQRRESYKEYKRNRKDVKEQKFYSSMEWLRLREDILRKYIYVDVFAYYTKGKIIEANTIHHIVETKEDWSLRLEKENLICLSNSSHRQIHNSYDKDDKTKREIQGLLRKMNNKFREEFGVS